MSNELDMDFMEDDFCNLADAIGKELEDYDGDSAQEECLNKLLRDAKDYILKLNKVANAAKVINADDWTRMFEDTAKQALSKALKELKDEV